MTNLQFPVRAFSALSRTVDAVARLIEITNDLITKNTSNEQKGLEEKLSKEVQCRPTFLIYKGAIVEAAPISMRIRGEDKELKNIIMPLYRINREGKLIPYIEDLDDLAKINYSYLKGNFDPPAQIAEAIPALSEFPCGEIEKASIKFVIRKYAIGEGKERLVEEYGKQLSVMADSYRPLPEQQFQKLDMKVVLNNSSDTHIIESMFRREQKSETDELYELLENVPINPPSTTKSKSTNCLVRKPFQ